MDKQLQVDQFFTVTLFAKVDGVVRFERKGRNKKQVSVYPVAQEA